MRKKEKFDNLEENHIIHCNKCERDLLKNSFNYKEVQENCEYGTCKYCEWLRRHNNIIPEVDDWLENDIKKLIDFILVDKSVYLNDVMYLFSDKTLEDLCKVSNVLKLGKPLKIKTTCEYCGKDVVEFPNVYLKNHNIYCSHECYYKDKPNKIPKGKDNPCYNRITTNCSFCGKEIHVIPYNYNIKNEHGDRFNFCSQKCYHSFRSIYHVEDKCPAYGREMTEEQKNKLKQASLKRMKSEDRLNSKIQIITNNILDNNNISYEREYFIEYYSVDNYLTEYNLMIEVMGNYWHANPIRYNSNKYLLNQKQKGWISNDKRKMSYVLNHYGIKILYLWETELDKSQELCEKLILEYIKANGKLENYHSFNYYIDQNKELQLRKEIITPYQNQNLDEYKHLIKVS